MTPQRRAMRAIEQNTAAALHWLDHEYPRLVRRAKRENAEIQQADDEVTSIDFDDLEPP